MRKLSIVLIFAITLSLTGCFDYRDVNKILPVTAVIVDIDNLGEATVYLEVFKSQRVVSNKMQQQKRIVYKGTGKTLTEIMEKLNNQSSFKLDYSQNKLIIFTKKIAEYGLEDYTDIFNRRPDFIIRENIVILDGDAEELVSLESEDEPFLGLFVHTLLNNKAIPSMLLAVDMKEFFNQRYIGDRVNSLPMIKVRNIASGKKIEVSEIALIKDYKMIGELATKESLAFNLLLDNYKEGTILVTNPQHENKFVTLKIKKNKTKTSVNYDGNTVNLMKEMKMTAYFAESQDSIDLTQENIKKIQKEAECTLKYQCQDLFSKYKKKGIDIFDIYEDFYRKYPHVNINPNTIIENTNLDVNINMEINSSLLKSGFGNPGD